mmetsp:Transcript_4260/g.8860  ORF Transcript_4260/g.8860 Transcript_4260/m.8860 type:complete len:285 (+) Transcript_4260:146-1000(+)
MDLWGLLVRYHIISLVEGLGGDFSHGGESHHFDAVFELLDLGFLLCQFLAMLRLDVFQHTGQRGNLVHKVELRLGLRIQNFLDVKAQIANFVFLDNLALFMEALHFVLCQDKVALGFDRPAQLFRHGFGLGSHLPHLFLEGMNLVVLLLVLDALVHAAEKALGRLDNVFIVAFFVVVLLKRVIALLAFFEIHRQGRWAKGRRFFARRKRSPVTNGIVSEWIAAVFGILADEGVLAEIVVGNLGIVFVTEGIQAEVIFNEGVLAEIICLAVAFLVGRGIQGSLLG